MATPPNCGPDPFITVPNQSNENIDPDHDKKSAFQTPLPSPTKYSVPTTPQPNKSTPLYRRFLKEVTMSPATPPRSPSPTKSRSSPPKRSDSPAKGRDSPTKVKLEVGQNGFHFTCEIPESKIVPKKTNKDNSTPTTRTPSPTKMGSAETDVPSRAATPVKETPLKRTSPAKQTPSRPEFNSPAVEKETPRKPIIRDLAAVGSSATRNGLPRKSAPTLAHKPRSKATTSTPNKHTSSARTSPTRSIKMATKFVEGGLTPRKDSKDVQDVHEGEAATCVHVVAATPTSTSSPRPPLNATGQAPTRTKRGASFDIGDMMKGLQADTSKPRPGDTSKPRPGVVERVDETNISELPTPLRKAAEVLQPIVSIAELRAKTGGATTETPIGTVPIILAEPVSEIRFTSPFKIQEQTLQYRPLLFPPPDPEAAEDERSPAKKHVKFDSVSDSAARKSSIPGLARSLRQSGTNQDVMLAIQQEMNILQSSLSNSLGVNFRFSKGKDKENTFELPVMANSLQGPESDVQSAIRPKRALLRTTSNMSNTSSSTTHSSVRASMFVHPKRSPSKLPTLKVPKWPYANMTPAQARRERLAVTKVDEYEDQMQQNSAREKVTARTSSKKAASTQTTKANGLKLPHRNRGAKSSTPARANVPVADTPSRPRTTPGAATTPSHSKFTTAKPKFAAGGVPKSARKSVFDSPAPTKTSSTPKSRPKTARPAAARKSPGPTLNPDGTPILKFANAQAIADCIAEWNSEDRKKADMGTPRNPADATPTKGSKVDSTTPKGSPEKSNEMGTNTLDKSPAKPSRLVAPKVKTLHLTPRRIAPATPKMQNKALARLRGAAPSTPASRALDPNAYRTPSKEIESSLDAAIDRKIEEDAKAGKVFTPGGNRVGVLLEARKWR